MKQTGAVTQFSWMDAVNNTDLTSAKGIQCSSLGNQKLRLAEKKTLFGSLVLTPLCVGEGGFSKVVLGHTAEGERVAVKVIEKRALNTLKSQELKSEIQVLRSISPFQHPNICNLIGAQEDQHQVRLVFSYFHMSLLEYCQFSHTIEENKARALFSQLVEAVHFLHVTFCTLSKQHQGTYICHRDLKLENIMLDASAERLALIDFGFATFAQPEVSLTKVCGSFHYIAPEILHRLPHDGRKTDIWALGCVLYAMVVGRQPFDHDLPEVLFQSIKQGNYFPIPSELSPELTQLIRGMLEVDPKKRLNIEEVKAHPWLGPRNPPT